MTPEALAALPREQRLILAAGAMRAGSTAIYNIARLLLEQEGGSLTAGWIKDITKPIGTTVLVKTHRWRPELAQRANVVLTCHRDLREVVRSLARMGWLGVGSAAFNQVDGIVQVHMQWKSRAAVDFAYEAMMADPRATVAEIASLLRIDAARVDFDAVTRDVAEMAAPLLLPEGQPHDNKTLLHVNHRSAGTIQPLEIENEIHHRFLDWQHAHGYF